MNEEDGKKKTVLLQQAGAAFSQRHYEVHIVGTLVLEIFKGKIGAHRKRTVLLGNTKGSSRYCPSGNGNGGRPIGLTERTNEVVVPSANVYMRKAHNHTSRSKKGSSKTILGYEGI
jgi:hypothetical protein